MGMQAEFLLGAMCRLGMAAILVQSAWHAMRDPVRHEVALAGYRLLPPRMVPAAAIVLPLLTLCASLLLPWPATAHAGGALGLALIALFTAAIAINLHRGRTDIDCGCGGAGGQHISRGLVVRNIILLVILAVASMGPASSVTDPMALVAALGGAAGIAALYFATTQLLANDAAMRAEAAHA
jgi:hypothetical protein